MDLMVDGARAIVFHLTTTWKKKKEFISINHIWVSRESRETNKLRFGQALFRLLIPEQ
jgi:hypothetical protein